MKYSKFDIDKIEQSSDIRDIIPNLQGSGASLYCTCPSCGKSGKNKGLIVSHKRSKGVMLNIAKCFSCGYTISGAIKAVEEFEGKNFIEAVEYLIDRYHIPVDKAEKKKKIQERKKLFEGSFCERQLFASGLSIDDVMVKVPIPGSDDFKLEPAFRKGGSDNIVMNLNDVDDEMLIYYYDLEGNHMTFQPKGRSSLKPRQYVRVRWSNPFAHSAEEGKEVKYQTPKGAPCAFYIPQYIRDKYKASEQIETLVIQEGEKKAEKACKHGIPSLGIQGIYNIGNAESGLLKELQYIVQRCKVRNVILLMDSDWDNLNKNLKQGSNIDARPNQFSKAVIKFQNYVKTLHRMNLPVDVFFGHINKNDKGAKGIDDLLISVLHLNENELKKDIDDTLLSHDGKGKYVDIHKITTKSELQIRDFWLLNSSKDFFEKYRQQILDLQFFRFGHINYVVEDGKIKESSRGASDSFFWNITLSEKGDKKIDFDNKGLLDFLEANNFGNIHTKDLKPGETKLVKVNDFIVSEIQVSNIRKFVFDYINQSTKDKDVINKFISKVESVVSPAKMELLQEIDNNFGTPEPYSQRYHYFSDCLYITADGINVESQSSMEWDKNVIRRKFVRKQVIEYIKKLDDGTFDIKFTDQGNNCEFLQYIMCTSNFWKGKEDALSDQEYQDAVKHIINKITALGFLMNSWKPRSEQIAIVAMDAKMDEVGSSNGRSGKSMIGQALQKILNLVTVDCKKMKNDDDFIYSLVTPETRVVFLDDTRVNFDFENFYSAITGDMQINPKQGSRYEIKFNEAPKFLITTNHALNDQSPSGKARRVMMAFSNFFTADFTPNDYFGHLLFDDWDDLQWQLFDNFMMECVHFYLKSMAEKWGAPGRGVIEPPMEQLNLRSLRQRMGEAFLQWADAYFDVASSNINTKIQRKVLYDKFHEEYPGSKHRISPNDFRKRMTAFCEYKGFHFNPSRKNEEGISFSDWSTVRNTPIFIGEPYKSNSVEYWMIATEEFSKSQLW